MLGTLYPWVKALHVMAVLAWMAGLFYLPRLYVYHAERGRDGAPEPASSFVIMEEKLLRVIMTPAAVTAWGAGLVLLATGNVDWSSVWPWTKAASVLAMTAFHLWLGRERAVLAAGGGSTGRRYRMLNELPTLLMVVIVLSVIVKF